jgi:hypothetical protein
MTGVLLLSDSGVWSIEGYDGQLSFGSEEQLEQPSSADYDADGDTTETVRAELEGFVADGAEISVGVTWSNATTAVVHTINDKEYPSPTEPTPTPTEPTATEPTASEPTASEPTATENS